MSLIPSFMGRRQFLVAAGLTSTAALAGKKIAGVMSSVCHGGAAMAAEKSITAGTKGIFSERYSHLLSPLKIGNVILKNRMMQSDSFPFCIQGPENFPSEQVISWYSDIAKNGCAICMCRGGDFPKAEEDKQIPEGEKEGPIPGGEQGGHVMGGAGAVTPVWDISDRRVQNYFTQMTDAVHFHGSKAALVLGVNVDRGYTIGNIAADYMAHTEEITMGPGKEIPVELMKKMINDVVEQAKLYQAMGFDMAHFHMSYRSGILAHALSPILNTRTDKYGGNIEKRARLPLELFQAVKKACGQNFLVGAHISGEEIGGGYTAEDAAEYAKIWEGALDILVVRGKDNNTSHPTAFNFKKGESPIIRYARTIKEGGTKVIIAPNGGFQDLNMNESYIETGKADMICMARTWWADPEYGKKAYEGRGEDVVPCLLCNDCHGVEGHVQGPVQSFCSVNPQIGHAHRIDRMIDDPVTPRKVAVIGGGPAGMKAAVVAAERGHNVTLYEKNDYLGGQLKHTDYVSFKWTYKDFKDYLIRQVEKSGIEVLLNVRATPEMIRSKGYDAVLVALGAEPIIPDIPGAKGSSVMAPIFAYGNKTIGKDVVVIGGEQIGTETGMYLAEKGHNVTVLTTEKSLATDANTLYLYPMRWKPLKTFNYITEVTATGVSEEKVTYRDAKGPVKSIRADSVVVYAGRKPRQEEAMKFYGSAKRFFIIGDCCSDDDIVRIVQGNIRKSMRTAFAAASKI